MSQAKSSVLLNDLMIKINSTMQHQGHVSRLIVSPQIFEELQFFSGLFPVDNLTLAGIPVEVSNCIPADYSVCEP